MENIIPFTKEIKFDDKISEITSISLEEEHDVSDYAIDGTFIISGDYKTHELSVNKKEFLYKLPFSVDLTDRIDTSTFNLEIADFSYDIVDDNILKANIEIKVSADIIEEKEEDVIEIVENLDEDENLNNERIDTEDQNTIMDTISDDNEYITYHVHMVKEAESIESICTLYNTSSETLEQYNDLSDFAIGKKLIVVEDE